ncbi:hypothetical protein RCG68_08370 [Kocuria sp. CPCC 205290]
MVVEVVETTTGEDGYRRAVRRLTLVVALLTFGQLFVWDNHDAHRSVFSSGCRWSACAPPWCWPR